MQMSLRLPSKHYDAVYRAASRERMTVPELIRKTIARQLRYQKSDERKPGR